MKVDDLTGIKLDYWTAKSEGLDVYIIKNRILKNWIRLEIDWNFIGEIIERDISDIKYKFHGKLHVKSDAHECNLFILGNSVTCYGATFLEAIKRCIVKYKYGETVND